MTQAQFVAAFTAALEAREWDLKKNDVKEILEIQSEVLMKALKDKKDGMAVIPGLGRFTLVKRAARWGTRPGTSERMRFKASKNVRVTVHKPLRDALGSK